MSGVWRLLVEGPGPPGWNMAVDAALLECALKEDTPPTLRLYWWRPHSLSLGLNQDAADSVDWEAVRSDRYGVVRRPTGGRAILHAEELTYSVTAPTPPGGIQEAYRWLAGGVQGGLERAGIRLELERSRRVRTSHDEVGSATSLKTSHPCFSAAGRYELVSDGRKVVGSAQCRRRGWMMQHGSILLGREHLNLPRYLVGVDTDREITKLDRATVDCSTLAGRPIEAADMISPFTEGFSRALGIRLEEGELTATERRCVEKLRLERFSNETWIRHGSGLRVAEATAGGGC